MPADFDGGGSMGRQRITLNLIILTESALHADEVCCGYSVLAERHGKIVHYSKNRIELETLK